ncbi:MAG: sugar-binding protein [Myxococcales bacterium]|nr:sugar-binding protein [Myxococcales bacterium]
MWRGRRVRASWVGWVVVCALGFAAGARAELGDESLGVNAHVPSDDLLEMARDLGVRWIRIDVNWRDVHTGPGRFRWEEIDRVVAGAGARGLNVFATLAYTPDWVGRVARARDDAWGGNDEPASSAEWVAFVEAAVERYRGRGVRHFGLWNEPNLDHFWEAAAGADAYIDKILLPGAAAVRARCRDCVVLAPDLAHLDDYHLFLDRVLARAADVIDVLAHHTYNGFPETGTGAFDGDNFLQALERRRFPFSRPGLREVLALHGWTREVWITETGYRARSMADETTQATYVRRVMEEQLRRSWWTNTFFYEITDCGVDQPDCPIDGFGLSRPLRPVSSGPRAFPRDYRLKPAYREIQRFVAEHPVIVGRAAPAACGNGVDDDGDGRIDERDRGCADATDRDETDDAAPPALEAVRARAAVRIDGDLADWPDGPEASPGLERWVGLAPVAGPTDVSVRLRAAWTDEALLLGAIVTDDVHHEDPPDVPLWQGDSLQIAFDVALDGAADYDEDDHEITVASRAGSARLSREHGPGGTAGIEASVRRDGRRTIYEVRIDRSALEPWRAITGGRIGFSFLVNDDDGERGRDGTGREGWLEWTAGIGLDKEPYDFGRLVLVERSESIRDAGSGDDAGTPPEADAGTGGDRAPSGGCTGCALPGRADRFGVPWLLVAGIAVVRRRRRRMR